MVDIVPVGTVSEAASKPRVLVTGCRPYTGGAFGAFGSTPHDPVDVSLNAQHGFEGAALPIARFVFTANPGEGEGLPAASDGEQTFLLPRGAQVLRAEVVSNTVASADPYRITNHDDSVVLLPAPNDGNVRRRYQVDSEAARMFKVSSTAAERADGFLLIEYF